jgi:CSLREA domain-containing protein
MRTLTPIVLATVLGSSAACHDAAPIPVAPSPPAMNVSSDGMWIVNSLADPGDGVCTNSECTLREAITAAEPGDSITFKGNVSGRILTVSSLIIAKSLTIAGPGARVMTIDGQNDHRAFQLDGQAVVTISGLNIIRGNDVNGGGIYVGELSRLTLAASVVAGNEASVGGGIFNGGTLTVVRSTVAGNTASLDGGGIVSEGERLTIVRSTVSGNRANGLGGGVFVCSSSATCPGNLTIRSSTITQNQASVQAGGLYLNEFGATGTVFNTIIAGNRALQGTSSECIAPGITSFGYNLTTLQQCSGLDATTDIRVDPAQVFTAVLEGLLADNGGQLPTHALIERGFAVDAGYCPGEGVDQRGLPRPYDDPRVPNVLDGCDIGAVEWQPLATKPNKS